MSRFTFTIVEGPESGRTLDLKVGKTYLGRLSISDDDKHQIYCWALRDGAVSRTHAEISMAEQGMPVLRHISDTNHTFVNGRRILRETLQPGHVIQIGQTSIRMEGNP